MEILRCLPVDPPFAFAISHACLNDDKTGPQEERIARKQTTSENALKNISKNSAERTLRSFLRWNKSRICSVISWMTAPLRRLTTDRTFLVFHRLYNCFRSAVILRGFKFVSSSNRERFFKPSQRMP